MYVGYLFILLSFALLSAFTTQVPIEGSTLPPELDSQDGSQLQGLDNDERIRNNLTVDRFNRSRMLTLSTTLGYDEWWFLTTRRPRLSLKDFPGRPGVATWREISPGSSVEDRKTRKPTSPTAASVSSGSSSFTSKYHYIQTIWKAYWIIFLLFCFCWT